MLALSHQCDCVSTKLPPLQKSVYLASLQNCLKPYAFFPMTSTDLNQICCFKFWSKQQMWIIIHQISFPNKKCGLCKACSDPIHFYFIKTFKLQMHNHWWFPLHLRSYTQLYLLGRIHSEVFKKRYSHATDQQTKTLKILKLSNILRLTKCSYIWSNVMMSNDKDME